MVFLVQDDIKMKVTGRSKKWESLIGIVKDLPIVISGCVWGKAHFWITNGDMPLTLEPAFLR